MRTLEALKARYDLAKNMFVRNREGVAFGRDGFSENPLSSEDEHPVGPIEAYAKAHTTGLGIHKWDHYLPVYDRHFAKFRGTEVHILEIGVFSGGSLEMWRDYFGPKAHIYGVDVREACLSYETDRTRIFIGDQSDPAFWAKFRAEVPDLDIVVDDGGHRAPEQIATIEGLLPHMRPGGVFVCEDVHFEYNPLLDYVNGLSREAARVPCWDQAGRGARSEAFSASDRLGSPLPVPRRHRETGRAARPVHVPQARHRMAASLILGGQAGSIFGVRRRPSTCSRWSTI